MKKLTLAIFLLIIAGGAFLRLDNLGEQSYWMDEGYTVNAIISAEQNGYSGKASVLDSGGKYFCPLYCYPAEKISQAIGQNAVAYRLLSAIFGILFITLMFFFTKKLSDSNGTALLTAFFTSFSYWQIAWSRQARWYTELEFFFWLALFCFLLFLSPRLKKSIPQNKTPNLKSIYHLAFSVLFIVAAIATHKLAYFLPIIMLVWYLLFIKEKNKNDEIVQPCQSNIKHVVFGIAICATLILFAEYGLGLHFIAHALKNIKLSYALPYYLSFYLRNYWLFIIVAVYGFFAAEKEKRKPFILLAIPLILYLAGLSFFTQIVHYRYLFHLTPIFFILASIAITNAAKKIKSSLITAKKIRQLAEGWIKIIPALFIFLIILIFFLAGQGVLAPKKFYQLESDDPSQFGRPYYAYTPQPDFNSAYAKIKENIKPEEIIISSHPHFNKIFLNQPGYWLRYNYLGMEDTPNTIKNNKEYYVNAEVINNLDELKKITAQKHGYIIFDYMSADGRIDPAIINYIQTNLNLFFYNKINSYSQVWVYSF
jgi:hypothetical protein